MEIEQTTEQQLLAQAKRSAAALESLRTIAIVWSSVALFAAVIWLIVTVNGGR